MPQPVALAIQVEGEREDAGALEAFGIGGRGLPAARHDALSVVNVDDAASRR